MALRSASGDAFDRMYADQQTTAHRKAAQVLETYSAFGDRPALRRFASLKVETVRDHLRQLQTLHL